jgi:hypothetical protein
VKFGRRRLLLLSAVGVVVVAVGILATTDALGIQHDVRTLKGAAADLRSSKSLFNIKPLLQVVSPAVSDVARRMARPWIRPGLWAFLGIGGGNATVSALREVSLALPNLSLGANALATSTKHGFSSIDLSAIAVASKQLALAMPHFVLASQDLKKVNSQRLPASLRKRFESLIALSSNSSNVLPAMEILQSALGANHSMRWLVVAQNPAESRGTGGIVGAYAIITAANGRLGIEQVGTDNNLHSLNAPPIDLGPDFNALYGTDPGIWQNTTLSPDFPSDAKIMVALWQKQSGEKVDGVIAVDPFVLAAILKASGPIHPPGGVEVNSANVVAESLSLAYQRFTNQSERKLYLANLFGLTLKRLFTSGVSPMSLALDLRGPLSEKRILAWSGDNKLESEIRSVGIAGTLSTDGPGTYRVVVVNSAGNKMDYYLDRQVDLRVESCKPQSRVKISARFLLNVPRNERLVDYVAGRLDLGKSTSQGGSSSLRLSFYAPPGSTLDRITVDGKEVGAVEGTEKGRDVAVLSLELSPRKESAVEAVFVGPPSTRLPQVIVQPLVRPQHTNIFPGCSRITP